MTLDEIVSQLWAAGEELGIEPELKLKPQRWQGANNKPSGAGRPAGSEKSSKWHALRWIVYENPEATVEKLKKLYHSRWKPEIAAGDPWRPMVSSSREVYNAQSWVRKHGKPTIDDA